MPVRKRGDVWYVRLQVRGVRIERAAGPRREDARALEAQIRSQALDQRLGRAPERTLTEAVVAWLKGEARALRSYQNLLDKVEAIRPHLDGKPLSAAIEAANAIKADGLERGLKPATINRRLAIVRDQLLAPAAIAEAQAQFAAALKALRTDHASTRQATERRRRDLEAEIGRVVDGIARVGVSDALAARLQALEAELAELQARAPAQAAAVAERTIEDALARYKRQVLDLQAALADDVQRARELLRELLGEITLAQDGEGVFAEVGQPGQRQEAAAGGLSMGLVAGTRFGNQRLRVG